MNHGPSIELLESNHEFPGVYQIKAIGVASDDFQGRVIGAVVSEVVDGADLEYTVRETPGGRHVAVTLRINVQSAENVRAIYARLHELEGLTLLL